MTTVWTIFHAGFPKNSWLSTRVLTVRLELYHPFPIIAQIDNFIPISAEFFKNIAHPFGCG